MGSYTLLALGLLGASTAFANPLKGHNVRAATTTSSSAASTAVPLGLNDLAKGMGKYFGTAADIPGTSELSDPYYMAELNNTRDFGQLTPGNIMKWQYIEPQQNVFNFTGADLFVSIAKDNGQLLRCHTLNWYNQNPSWLTNGLWTNETLLAALTNHIDKVITHFGNDCYHWDVVNEAVTDAGEWRQDVWYNVTGESFLYTAFAAAEAAVKRNNLTTKLYYNDYNIEGGGGKSEAVQKIVKSIKDRGIQIDGVGFQSHFYVGQTPSTQRLVDGMKAFIDLGVEIAITELDIRTPLPATLMAANQQALDFNTTVAACAQVEKCVGITVWDFVDETSWIPYTFPGQGYANLFAQPGGVRTPLIRKVAYDGVVAGFTGQPVSMVVMKPIGNALAALKNSIAALLGGVRTRLAI